MWETQTDKQRQRDRDWNRQTQRKRITHHHTKFTPSYCSEKIRDQTDNQRLFWFNSSFHHMATTQASEVVAWLVCEEGMSRRDLPIISPPVCPGYFRTISPEVWYCVLQRTTRNGKNRQSRHEVGAGFILQLGEIIGELHFRTWTEAHWYACLCFSVSVSLSVPLSLSLCFSASVCLSVCFSLSLCI